MDKGEEVRRGASRFITTKGHINGQSGGSGKHKVSAGGFSDIRGDLQFSEKSKKEKVRSLSAVGKALSSYQDNEMGCHVSEKLDGSPSSATIPTKRCKLPSKFFDDCKGVDHASVPRKTRSAMKKRGSESFLTDSEKKQGSPDWSTRQTVYGPITKDEEEVVETLYSMAGMFPDNGSSARSQRDCESLPENSSVSQDLKERANATFEGTIQDASTCPDISLRGAAKISSSIETVGQEQTDFRQSAKFLGSSHSTAPTINLQAIPMMVRCENGSKAALHDSELCLTMGLNLPRQSQILHNGRKPDVEFETARGIDCKQEQNMIKDKKANEGPALWPGLSPRAYSRINASNLQSSAAKAPDWLNTAISSSKLGLMESCSSAGKISEVVNCKKSWKRCGAHVHISHLIQSLEVQKAQVAKEPELYECHQRVDEGSKCGVLMDSHNLNGMSNGISCAPGTVHSATGRDSHGHHDISQAPPTPGAHGPQKQSFNFLSLSVGSNGLKVNDSFNNMGGRLEPLSRLQMPYFQSLQQQHGLMPIPTPQTQYASTPYLDQLPVAGPQVRLQQPHYYGSPIYGSHYSSTASNKKQQQSFWAMQHAAQGRSVVNSNNVRAQYPNWQNGRHDSSAASPCPQVILPHSPASLGAVGSKIGSISGQEQQLIALTSSLPPSRTNGLDFHVPSVCEESTGRFHGSGTHSLQLLCDERI